jgi:hypothetical protein
MSHRSPHASFTYPHKAAKLGMLEKLRNDLAFKLDRIFHDKSLAVFRPTRNLRVARIYHMIGFYKERGVQEARSELKQAVMVERSHPPMTQHLGERDIFSSYVRNS